MIKHLIDLDEMALPQLDALIAQALEIGTQPGGYYDRCRGKILATLFYEPSTRTQMSFQTAMLRLGGRIIGFDNPSNSSVSKGESLKDTVRVVSGYADIIVLRHPCAGSALAASMCSKTPVINAGDGGHLHPTQTLTDLVTLSAKKGRLTGLTVGVCGDLKNGRTVHSLIKAMCRFDGTRFALISTGELGVPSYIKDMMDANGCPYTEYESLEDAIGSLDVLYMTRIQKERFGSDDAYERQKGVFVLDGRKLTKAKPDLCVLHPLPRVDEITDEIDLDPRAGYFDQAEYGVFARMALIMHLLEGSQKQTPVLPAADGEICNNPHCITKQEGYLPNLSLKSGEGNVCRYCEE